MFNRASFGYEHVVGAGTGGVGHTAKQDQTEPDSTHCLRHLGRPIFQTSLLKPPDLSALLAVTT